MSDRALRKSLGFSQREFADFLGISRVQVAQAESGIRKWPEHALYKVVKVESFMKEESEKAPMDLDLSLIKEQQSSLRQWLEEGIKKKERVLENKTKRLAEKKSQHAKAIQQLRLLALEKHLFRDVPSYLAELEKNEKQAKEVFHSTHAIALEEEEMRLRETKMILDMYREKLDELLTQIPH